MKTTTEADGHISCFESIESDQIDWKGNYWNLVGSFGFIYFIVNIFGFLFSFYYLSYRYLNNSYVSPIITLLLVLSIIAFGIKIFLLLLPKVLIDYYLIKYFTQQIALTPEHLIITRVNRKGHQTKIRIGWQKLTINIKYIKGRPYLMFGSKGRWWRHVQDVYLDWNLAIFKEIVAEVQARKLHISPTTPPS